MRVLFDQATPVPIRPFLIGHTVRTAAQEHWDTLKNGDLLIAAEDAGGCNLRATLNFVLPPPGHDLEWVICREAP
jgi:hypothetical protein